MSFAILKHTLHTTTPPVHCSRAFWAKLAKTRRGLTTISMPHGDLEVDFSWDVQVRRQTHV